MGSGLGHTATAVLPVLFVAGSSFLMRRFDLLSKTAVGDLSRLCYRLFIPSLIFVNIVTSFTAAQLSKLWLMPVVALIYPFVGILVGAIIIAGFRISLKSHQKVTLACMAFPNSAYLPLAVMNVLSSQSPFVDPFPSVADAQTAAAAYIALYNAVFDMVMFSLGSYLLSGDEPRDGKVGNTVSSQRTANKRLSISVGPKLLKAASQRSIALALGAGGGGGGGNSSPRSLTRQPANGLPMGRLSISGKRNFSSEGGFRPGSVGNTGLLLSMSVPRSEARPLESSATTGGGGGSGYQPPRPPLTIARSLGTSFGAERGSLLSHSLSRGGGVGRSGRVKDSSPLDSITDTDRASDASAPDTDLKAGLLANQTADESNDLAGDKRFASQPLPYRPTATTAATAATPSVGAPSSAAAGGETKRDTSVSPVVVENLPVTDVTDDDDDEEESDPNRGDPTGGRCGPHCRKGGVFGPGTCCNSFTKSLIASLSTVVTPPFVAGLAALFVVLITPLRDLLVKSDPLSASTPPLYFITQTLQTLQNATVAAGILILGLGISNAIAAQQEAEKAAIAMKAAAAAAAAAGAPAAAPGDDGLVALPAPAAGLPAPPGAAPTVGEKAAIPMLSWPLMIILMVAKLFVMPIIGMGFYAAFNSAGLFDGHDKIYRFVFVLESAPPTALALIMLCEINLGSSVAVSRLLCWEYLLSLVSLPVVMAIFAALIT